MSAPAAPAPMTGPGEMFELVEEEIDGVRQRVFLHAPPSLPSIWQASAGHGDRAYLVYEGDRLTYGEAHEQVARLAAHLSHVVGVRQGDRVAIAMRNYPEWVVAFWATVSLGAVVVPLNAWWTGPELAYGLTHSGSRVLLADGDRLASLASHLPETPVASIVAARTDDLPDGAVALADVLAAPAAAPAPAVEVAPDDIALVMYTSGTTGRPKGAVQSHRNITSQVMNGMYTVLVRGLGGATAAPAADEGDAAPPPGGPVTLLTFPLFHVGGLHSFLIPYTVSGGTVVLLHKWDAAKALDLVEREGVTAVGGVPTTMFELLDEARRQGRTLPSLAGVASGATLVPPELVRRIDDQLEHRAAPTNGYGLTETSGAAVANAGTDYVGHPDSVGLPISPAMEVRIAGPDGQAVAAGDTGEIWIKGPSVFKGYLDAPEATAAALTDGWFRTGDVGRLDEDGYLYVVDRLKDVIIRGGENVYAAEVEAALYEHPDVAEAAIVGVPDERLGEAVAAVVRLRPEAAGVDADALRQHLAGRLAAFKVPSVVLVTPDTLPRNAAGKVLKRELRTLLDPQ